MTKVFNKLKDDRGALIVEASLSLPFFIFTIFIMLSIINICYVQAKVGSALASASKEISQYSYIYYMLNGDGAQQSVAAKGTDVNKMLQNANDLADATLYQTGKASESWDDFSGTYDELSGQLEHYADNPTDLLIGIFASDINNAADSVKNTVGKFLATAFMQKNLIESKGGSADRFLKHMHVVDGLKGLDCTAELFPGGQAHEISITVNYQVQVIKLLGFDFKFDFSQTARTEAWGRGAAKAA